MTRFSTLLLPEWLYLANASSAQAPQIWRLPLPSKKVGWIPSWRLSRGSLRHLCIEPLPEALVPLQTMLTPLSLNTHLLIRSKVCVRYWFIIMKWELRSYVSVYIQDQMINLKRFISNKSSQSQPNFQKTHSPYATQTPQPTLCVNLIGPRQRRYDLVVACPHRLRNLQRNLHLNLCGGATGVSVCWTRSTKSNMCLAITHVPNIFDQQQTSRSTATLWKFSTDVLCC